MAVPAPLLALITQLTANSHYDTAPKFAKRWITNNNEVLDYIQAIDDYVDQNEDLTALQVYKKIVAAIPAPQQSMFKQWRNVQAAAAAPPVLPNTLRDISHIKQ